ncbi:MAG: hypothetical protein ACRDPR_16705 [Nocardioidaceae bacterium]
MAAISAAVVAAVLVAVTVGGGDDTSAPATTTAPVTTPTTAAAPSTTATVATTAPADPVVEAVKAQYFRFWRAFDDYGRATGPFDPVEFKNTFGPVASGGEYTHLFDYFQSNRIKGLAFRGGRPPEEELAPRITLESPAEATIEDCSSSSGETYKVATREVVEPADASPARMVVVMRLIDGAWKVTSVAGRDEPCAR